MIDIAQNTEEGIIYITEIGKINYEDKIDLIKRLLPFLKDNESIKILHDMRKAEYNSSDIVKENLHDLTSLFRNKKNIIKHAAVHQSTVGTAISMLFERTELPKSFKHKIFYSKKTALQWLLET